MAWDMLDTLLENLSADDRTKVLLKVCPPSADVQALDAKTTELQKEWNPTGYYTADQMRQVIGATMAMVNQYHNSVMAAQARRTIKELDDAEETFFEIGKQAVTYTMTWQKAQASGTIINAPGLKTWVVNATRSMNKGMRAVQIATCTEPFWFTAIASYTAVFDVLRSVVVKIIGVTIKAGQIVLDAVETGVSLWPFLKWGAVGVGAIFLGVWAWNKIEGAAEAGRRPFNWSRLNPIPRVRGLVQRRSPPVSGYHRYRRRRR